MVKLLFEGVGTKFTTACFKSSSKEDPDKTQSDSDAQAQAPGPSVQLVSSAPAPPRPLPLPHPRNRGLSWVPWDKIMRATMRAFPTPYQLRLFSYREVASATSDFKSEFFLGEGGYGPVYWGKLEDGQEIAVKQLDVDGRQGSREFLTEIVIVSHLDHPNLVKLIGYCARGDHRLLVYEYMPSGSLADHLFYRPEKRKALDWNTRMKIAAGAALGLQYLHSTADPPVIHRDVKCANILLDADFTPKLADFGLSKLAPRIDGHTHFSTRVVGTYGYRDPDYVATGHLTFKSDIYSFGVVLLELINGGNVIDERRPANQRNLVEWVRELSVDPNQFPVMADPELEGRFPVKEFIKAAAAAALCTEKASYRPAFSLVVDGLTYCASQVYDEPNKADNVVGESSAAAEVRLSLSGRRRALDASAAAAASDLDDKAKGKRPRCDVDAASDSSDDT